MKGQFNSLSVMTQQVSLEGHLLIFHNLILLAHYLKSGVQFDSKTMYKPYSVHY